MLGTHHIEQHLHYFQKGKKELLLFYISIFFKQIGISLVGIFVPIFFYKLGYSIEKILFFYFLLSLFYLFISYPIAKVITKIGEKHAMVIASFSDIFFFLGLYYLKTYPYFFSLLAFISALSLAFYWMSYHLLFTQESHKEKRGEEISIIGILVIIAGIISPFIGGIIAEKHFTTLFLVSTFFIILSIIPLIFSKDRKPKMEFHFQDILKKMIEKEWRGNIISFSAFSIDYIVTLIIWPLFIIIVIKNLEKTGLIVSLTAFLSLIIYRIVGKYSDKTNKIKLLKKGNIFYSLTLFLRIFATSASLVFLVDFLKKVSEKILFVPWQSHMIDLSQRGDYFSFIFLRENYYKLLRVIILPFFILIFHFHFYPFITTFLIATLFSFGYRYIHK